MSKQFGDYCGPLLWFLKISQSLRRNINTACQLNAGSYGVAVKAREREKEERNT